RLPLLTREPPFDLRGAVLSPAPYDLHVVLLESFMDPEDMTGLRLVPVAGAPAHRRPPRGEPSYAWSPTMGGKTARAEFEVLCGVPDFEMLGSITFNQLGGGAVGCLPTLLSRLGYRTIASQALPASFFNIGEAYRSMGFAEQRL